ncbi:unnamed protein product [Auanema sp. JU1783]|nr:unnamed protein product [Auanema sp. JU1783]
MNRLSVLSVLLIVCTVVHQAQQHVLFGAADADDIMRFQDLPAKRFYAWEDGKRSDPISEYKQIADKRKQFYAWAGKRSASGVPDMEKRKQFYAWAGRK